MVVFFDIYEEVLGELNQRTLHNLCFYSPWDYSPQEQGHEDVLGKANRRQKYHSLVCRYHDEPNECGEGSNGAQVEYPPHQDTLDLKTWLAVKANSFYISRIRDAQDA
jgi:hypothetical protein